MLAFSQLLPLTGDVASLAAVPGLHSEVVPTFDIRRTSNQADRPAFDLLN